MANYGSREMPISWVIYNSLWIIWSFIPILNWIGFLYVSIKIRNVKWLCFSCIYALLGFLPFVLYMYFNFTLTTLFSFIFVIAWMASIVHSILARRRYLNQLATKINGNKGDALAQFKMHQNQKSKTVKKNHQSKTTKKKHQSNTAERSLDLNHCTEQQLADLPGVSMIEAKKAIQFRLNKKGFTSVDDFVKYLKIQPHFEEQIRKQVFVSSVINPDSDTEDKDRLVDI